MIDLTADDDDKPQRPTTAADASADARGRDASTAIAVGSSDDEADDEPRPPPKKRARPDADAVDEDAESSEDAADAEEADAASSEDDGEPGPYRDLGIFTADFSGSHGFACLFERGTAERGKCCRRTNDRLDHLCYASEADIQNGGLQGGFGMVREPENAYDANAIRVTYAGARAGYVPKALAAVLATPLDLRVVRVKGVGAPGPPGKRHHCSFLLEVLEIAGDSVPDELDALCEY